MDNNRLRRHIASICVWMIVLAGYPFNFRYAFGYPFLVPIAIGLVILWLMLSRVFRAHKIFIRLYAALIAFWMIQLVFRADIEYVSNIFQAFCVVTIYLAVVNVIGVSSMSRQFVYFMIANCIGGTIISLLLFVYDFPPLFQFVQHDSRIGSFYYLTFTNTTFDGDDFTAIRYSGLFDEPGAVSFGCMFALILNKLALKSRKAELLLLILPLFTYSLAHFVTAVLYILLFYWRKAKLMLIGGILLFGLYLFLESTQGTEYNRLYKLTIERLEADDNGGIKGNSRKGETDICKEYFMERPLTGWGKTYFTENPSKGAGVIGTNIYYNGALFGILGYVFPYIFIHYMIFSLLCKYRMASGASDGLKCCLLIVINLLQRSYVTTIFPLFALTIIALCVYEITSKNNPKHYLYAANEIK